MTHPEMERLLALHDRWSAYDVLLLILTLVLGLVLVGGSFIALDADQNGLAVLLVVPGVILCGVGLHKEPYQAR